MKAQLFSSIFKVTTLFLLISALSCTQTRKEEPIAPLVTPSSFVGFNIAFPVNELEDGINSLLKTTLVDDVIDLNKKGDKLFLKVVKNGKLRLALRQDKVFASIPLIVNVAIKKKVMGISFSNKDTPVSFEGIIETQATTSLDSIWNFNLDCQGINMKWISKPAIDILGVSIDLRKSIDKAIYQNEEKILSEICGAINQSIDFKKALSKVWKSIQKPIRIAKKPVDIWLHTIPDALNAKILPMVRDTLWIHAEYHGKIFISTEKDRVHQEVALPLKGDVLNYKSAIISYIQAEVPLLRVEEFISEKMVGNTFRYEGYDATLSKIQIGSKGQKISALATVTGGLSAQITIEGKPTLTQDLKLTLEDFDYDIKSEDQLANAASWLSNGLIESYISSMISIEMSPLFNRLDSLANAGISRSKIGHKLKTDLVFNEIKSFDQQIEGDTLKWIMYLEGKANLVLKKGVFEKINNK